MLKLIIWDLDDTLWEGTLAEGDDVKLIDSRVDCIKALNAQGVVNSICSKNDFETAKAKLIEFGIWDEFVFPEIAFEPKGSIVHRIVTDMQLRFPDVVFADDNPHNLEEVKHFCEGIQVQDATSPEFDSFLRAAVEESKGGKSRVERYRILEKKRADRAETGGSNEDFLKQSNIRVTFVRLADNLDHARRIEELINRTNQLNFLKSRVPEGSMEEHVIASTQNNTVSAFVWDNYGYYGLVGFGSFSRNRQLNHFTFSCRTMNMGIESALADQLQKLSGTAPLDLPVEPKTPAWITVVPVDSEEAQDAIRRSSDEAPEDAPIRVMANCQSAAIAHYMNVSEPIDYDNWPRTFMLSKLINFNEMVGRWRPYMVYGAFVDYVAQYWRNGEMPTPEKFENAARKFLDEAKSHESKVVILLPVEEFTNVDETAGRTPGEFEWKNSVWRALSEEYTDVEIVDLADVPGVTGSADPRHFSREQLIDIAQRVNKAIAQLEN